MNQQACLFASDRAALRQLCIENPEQILDFGNKFRCFVLILGDHFEGDESNRLLAFERAIRETTVLPLHELLTQFLTHDPTSDEAIVRPIITEAVTRHWLQDIDAFVLFPKSVEMKITGFMPYTSFYEDFLFLEKLR